MSAFVAVGCGATENRGAPPGSLAGGAGAPASSGGSTAAGGTAGDAGGAGTAVAGAAEPLVPVAGTGGVTSCSLPVAATPVFADQAVPALAPARRELYSWTTEEQVREIRAGRVLLTREEREGQGPGFAIEYLKQRAQSFVGEQAALAELLLSSAYAKVRYAWPNPWATRLGFPGENYGNQLLRMVLREEARLVLFRQGSLSVVDMHNATVTVADALAEPERIAGIYFLKDGEAGGAHCGTFSSGGSGYREFIIGNEAMLEEWSLGTEAMRERLLADAARLEAFLRVVRACPERNAARDWSLELSCAWERGAGAGDTEQGHYEAALALASPYYLPAPAELVHLIETLRGDIFEPEPLVVQPGK